MPSSQLALLTQQIESQNTDEFGKFYMYVSLLNAVTVRNKTFAQSLECTKARIMLVNETLNTGALDTDYFSNQITLYARHFLPSSPDWLNALSNTAMSYVRRGTVSDLAYITDKMLEHLMAINNQQLHNNHIYTAVDFHKNQNALIELIKHLATTNKEILSLVDKGCNTALSSALAIAGLVLILASAFSIFPAIIGLGLMAGGAYAAYSYANQAAGHAKKIEAYSEELSQKMNKTINENSSTQSFYNNRNKTAFYHSIFTPLSYTPLTAAEQLFTDQDGLQKTRNEFNSALSSHAL